MSEPFLVLEKISKSFPGVQALDSVHLEVDRGECHALVGENGAGKSTLMKVLSGAVVPDSGIVKLDGDRVLIDSPASARRHGIAMIYQELNLLPELTVAENVFLGREPRNRFGLLDRKEMIRQARVWLERLHQDIDPGALTRRLPLARQQMV